MITKRYSCSYAGFLVPRDGISTLLDSTIDSITTSIQPSPRDDLLATQPISIAASTTKAGIGDYVANGIAGVGNQNGPSKLSSSKSALLRTVTKATEAPAYIVKGGNSTLAAATSSSSTPTVVCYTIKSWAQTAAGYSTYPSMPSISSGNSSIDQCWVQWSNYWQFEADYGGHEWYPSTIGTTKTVTDLYMWSRLWESACIHSYAAMSTSYAGRPWSVVPGTPFTDTYTNTIVADGFTKTTETVTHTQTGGFITALSSVTPITTITSMTSYTETSVHDIQLFSLSQPHPDCELPSSVPQCQALWNKWASVQVNTSTPTVTRCWTENCEGSWNTYDSAWSLYSYMKSVPAPACTQASLGASLCNALRSSYEARGLSENNALTTSNGITGYSGGFQILTAAASGSEGLGMSFGTTQVTNLSVSWPKSSTLGVGCTLGCGSCAITGGTVQLIYWQQAKSTSTSDVGQSSVPKSNEVVVATTLGTVFTSPTVYISLADVHAADSCSSVGSTHGNTILPLTNTKGLSSVWADWRHGISTALFNFTDLVTPIPTSIYTRQPWCAMWSSSMWAQDLNFGDCNGTITDYTCYPACPRTEPYNPILVLPSGLLNPIEPAWASCTLDIRGVYDPPIYLTPYASAAQPTPAPLSWSTDPQSQAPTTESVPKIQTPMQTSTLLSATPIPSSASLDPSNVQSSPMSAIASVVMSAFHQPFSLQSQPDSKGLATMDPHLLKTVEPSTLVDPSSAAQSIMTALDPSRATHSAPANIPPSNSQLDPPATSPSIGQIISTAPLDSGTQSPGRFTDTAYHSSFVTNSIRETSTIVSSSPLQSHEPSAILSSPILNPTIGDPSVDSDTYGITIQTGETTNILGAPSTAPPASPLSVGGHSISPDPRGSGVLIGGTTFNPGVLTTVEGTPISIGTNGIVVAGSSTISLYTAALNTSPSRASLASSVPIVVLTIGGATYTAESGRPLNIDGIAVSQGVPAATISGQIVSMGVSGVNVGDSEVVYSSTPTTTSSLQEHKTLVISGTPYTVYAGSSDEGVIVGPSSFLKTLSISGPAATLGGQIITAETNGVEVETPITPSADPLESAGQEAVLTAKGHSYTATAMPALSGDVSIAVIGTSLTLSSDGPGAVFAGQRVSLAAAGLVINETLTMAWSSMDSTLTSNASSIPGTTAVLPSVPSEATWRGAATASTTANGVDGFPTRGRLIEGAAILVTLISYCLL